MSQSAVPILERWEEGVGRTGFAFAKATKQGQRRCVILRDLAVVRNDAVHDQNLRLIR
jgi:hypothetical protein